MRIGIMAEPFVQKLDQIKEEVALAQASGVSTYWLAQIWRYDALTLIPILAKMAPDLEFASGVVASYLRHPMTLASQALTVSLLTNGKFTLGLGLMHKPLIEGMFEMSFDKPARHMREYLEILLPALEQKNVDVSGTTVSYHGDMDVPDAPRTPVMLAALGPHMLKLCGSYTDGTIMWMTGPRTLREDVLPKLESAAETYAVYGEMPSYAAMLEREGLYAPEDYVLVGSDEHVREQISSYEAAGVTDFGIQIAPSGERARTLEFVAALAREHRHT